MANTLSSAAKQSGRKEKESGKKETGLEGDWVEEEIERLLQQIDPDDPEHEVQEQLQEQLQDSPSAVPVPGDPGVSTLFAGYLDTVHSQHLDMQSLLLDTQGSLATTNNAREGHESVGCDVEEVISELQQKLSSEMTNQQDGATTESAAEPTPSGKELPGVRASASNTKEITGPAANSEVFCSVPSSKALIAVAPHVTIFTSPAENSGSEKRIEGETSKEKKLKKGIGGDGCCGSLGVRVCGEDDDETRDGGADVTGTEDWRELSSAEEGEVLCGVQHERLGSGGQVMPGVRDEVQTALAQLEEEKKRWERELANQQKEKEAAITVQIEETRRMLEEEQKAMAERTARLNKVKLEAVVTLQAHWRGHRTRKQYKDRLDAVRSHRLQERNRAAHLLQAIWRGVFVRKIFGPQLEARRERRRELARKKALQVEQTKNRSATKVQAHWRGYRSRCVYGPILNALREKRIAEQARRQAEVDRMYHHQATILQAAWRGHAVRKEHGPVLKSRREERMRERFQKRHRAATIIQASWRGHSVRHRIIPQLLAVKSEQNKKSTLDQSMEKTQMDGIRKDHTHSSKGSQTKKQETPSTKAACSQGQNPSTGSGKLTVMKRIQSALRLQEERGIPAPEMGKSSDVRDLGHARTRGEFSKSTHMQCQFDESSGSEEEEEGEEEGVQGLAEEQKAMTSLIASRRREEGLAQQSRIRMSMVMTHKDAEKASITKKSQSTYRKEVEHAASPLPPQAWLGVIEERRQQWMATRVLWRNPSPSQTEPCYSTYTSRAQLNVCPLSDVQLLAASPRGTPLDQVTQVILYGCRTVPDVHCLSRCPQLCSLSLIKCGMASLTSLPSSLQLIDVNVQSNILEQVELCDVASSLRFLDLSENRLSSVHGLSHCHHLLELDLSGNRITRFGGLGGCWRLQHLSIDSNLLVACVGLEGLPYLQYFSCAENHLPFVDGLQHCHLLSAVCMQQNNLQEVPSLPHHVLLRELRLEENSLTSIYPICHSWLPLLQTLSLSGNCITHLDSLIPFIMLQTLDISNNSIYDLPLLLQSLRGCMELKNVNLTGNPVAEEPQLCSHLLKILPNLEHVDSRTLLERKKRCGLSEVVTSSALYQLCKRQISEQDNMKEYYNSEIEKLQNSSKAEPDDVRKLLQTKILYCQEYEALLIKHLREQETFGMTITTPGKKRRKRHQKRPKNTPRVPDAHKAATKIQSVWRGRTVRKRKHAHQMAAVKIQAVWRGTLTRRLMKSMREEGKQQDWAATIIQAIYRGHSLRRKLREVMERARHVSDDDASFEEDISMDCVDEDLLKEDVHPLSPVSQTAVPMEHSLHHYPHSSQSPHSHHHSSPTATGQGQSPSSAVWVPVFALPGSTETYVPVEQWQSEQQQQFTQKSSGSVISDTKPTHSAITQATVSSSHIASPVADNDELHHQPPKEVWSVMEPTVEMEEAIPSTVSLSDPLQEQAQVSTETRTKNDIANEWSFKSEATAQLMMKRSERQKKLEYKAARRKKLADPIERLAEFHKHGRSAPIGIRTHASKRQDSVQGKLQSSPTPISFKQSPGKDPVMYQWVHDHRVQHRQSVGGSGRMSGWAMRDPKVPNRRRQQMEHEPSAVTKPSAQCSLPQLDSRVLAGHAPRLVSNTDSSSQKRGSSSRSAALKSRSLHATAADIYENYHQQSTSSTPAMRYVFRQEHKH